MAPHFFGPEAWAPLAKALVAYDGGDQGATLRVHSDLGEPELMAVSIFFRSPEELRDVDREALNLVHGRVLDVGAGVGSLSLTLQDRGVDVTAIEVIPEAVDIMVRRGVREARLGWVQDLPASATFNTILLLMNGAALAGTMAGLPPLLRALGRLLAPGGQLLLDSTDLIQTGGGESEIPGDEEGRYPGELHYQMEFRGERGAPFPQLFVDPVTLEATASEEGWMTELVREEEAGGFLAKLTRASTARQGP